MRLFSIFRSELYKFFPLFAPILISQYAQTANGIVDTVMTARLGATELGGVAVGVALWMPVYMFVIGVLFGVLIIIARYFGANDVKQVRSFAWQGIWMGSGLGFCASLLVYMISLRMEFFGVDEQLAHTAQAYVRMVLIGFPFGAAAVALRFYCEGQKAIFPVTFMAILIVCFNAVFNYLLMCGNLGFPALGARGCGLATSLSMVMFLVMLIGYTGFSKRFKAYRLLTGVCRPRADAFKNIFKLGIPIGFGFTNEYLVLSVITLFIGSTGALPVSAHQAAFSCMMLFFTIPAAVSFAASIRISNLMGARDFVQLGHAANSILLFSSMIGMTISFLIFFQAEQLAVLIADNPEIASLASDLIRISAFFLLADAIQICCNGILRGAGDTAIPFAVTACSYWLVCIPLGYFLSGMPLPWEVSISADLFGLRGWWYALTISISLTAVLLYLRLRIIIFQSR